ncbi:MAG: hypothetical protein QF441_11420 [Bacteriovoracaceae bacterium]|jgi:hypothetical protein|nr:hypothetical protein [Halobacteriovoraceae bacterium]MDP7321213.1 hypothetical protein [Bacteriovoracaceae bacterium]
MKKVLSKFNKFLINGFLYLSPVGVFILIMVSLGLYEMIDKHWSGQILGYLFLFWFFCSVYFLLSLIVNKKLRESIFTRLAGIKERDEREEIVVGKAMKSSFLFTLGLLVCLLAFSTTRTDKNTTLTTDSNFRGSFTIGHLEFKGEPIRKYEKETHGDIHQFETYDIPLSKTSLILIIILAQLFSYHLFARRELRS